MITMLAVTIASLAVALVMSAAAWQTIREERRRSHARVESLAVEIEDLGAEAPAPVAVNDLFAAEAHPRTNSTWLNALTAGVIVVGGAVGLAVAAAGPRGGADPPVAATTSATDAAPPVELLSLESELRGDRLVVRGTVRNPSPTAGAPLSAAVSVFGRDGNFVAGGRAPLKTPALTAGPAGVESRFEVAVIVEGDVRRYRVGFWNGDHAVVHVDRRDHASAARVP